MSNSDSSFDASQRGFNYDTKYLILMRNLPWSATKPQIAEFLGNVSILNGLDGIHFIINEMDMKKVEAYIQLEQLREYMAALKMNGKCMDDQLVEGTYVNDDIFMLSSHIISFCDFSIASTTIASIQQFGQSTENSIKRACCFH